MHWTKAALMYSIHTGPAATKTQTLKALETIPLHFKVFVQHKAVLKSYFYGVLISFCELEVITFKAAV